MPDGGLVGGGDEFRRKLKSVMPGSGALGKRRESLMRKFIRYFFGTIAHPGAAFDALAAEHSLRWAAAAACLPVLQVWGNMAIHAAFGLDWLGTRPILTDPTFIAFFGHLRIDLDAWVPVFAGFMPLLALIDLVVIPGTAHLLGKLWGGKGTFEQMVNALTFASVVPNIVIGAASEWIFSVPMDLITGNGYWWNAAMQGEFGAAAAAVWNVYVIGVYVGVQWIWIIVLGAVAIRRIQRIPAWAAALTMSAAFFLSMFLSSLFVR